MSRTPAQRLPVPVVAGQVTFAAQNDSRTLGQPRVGTAWQLGGLTVVDQSAGTMTLQLVIGGEVVDSFSFDAASGIGPTVYHAYTVPFIIFDTTSIYLKAGSSAPTPGYPRTFRYRGQVAYI